MLIARLSISALPIPGRYITWAWLVCWLIFCEGVIYSPIRPTGLNIGAHKEAAEHFLSALMMQQSNNGEAGDQLWFTLRRAFLAMVCDY